MIKAAIMGYGTVGAGVYEAVQVNQEVIEREVGEGLSIKRILDLRSFPGDPAEKMRRFLWLSRPWAARRRPMSL